MDDSDKSRELLIEELSTARQRVAALEAAEHHRIRMQTELQRTEADYRELVEGVNSIILRMDTQGNLTYANEFTYRFFGYSKEEILGKNVVGTIVPEVEFTGRDLAQHIRDICEHPERFESNENENLCRDGRRVWVSWKNKPVRDESGRVTEVLCIGVDITHRKRFEQALEASQRHCRDLFDATTNAILVIDPATGRIADANPAAMEMSGYGRDELFALALGELSQGSPPYSHEDALACLRKTMEEGPQVFEWRAKRKGGELLWVEVTVKPVSIDGEARVLAVICDITARKEAEARVRQEQKTLRQLLEVQEWERRLIAYEIHDGLAQLLTGATMQLDVALRLWTEDPAAAAKAFQTGKEALDQALAEARRLIRGLRSPVLEESGVVAAIEQLIAEGAGQPGPTVEFHPNVRFQRLDPLLENALFRIAQESLTNARRYSGSNTVRVELTEFDGRIVLEVRDWGIGFDPQQVDPNRFGLRGIRERARVLGGQATIQSRPGEGTTVRVELPSGIASAENGTAE